MATCVANINSRIAANTADSIPELFPNTLTPVSFNVATNQLFRIEVPNFQSITFRLLLVTSLPSVNVTFSVYKWNNDNTITDLGSVIVDELVSTFSKDFTLGRFFICIRTTSGSYSGTITSSFTGYPANARIAVDIGTGCVATFKFDDTPPPRACSEPLFFEILDGSLPPGIIMNGLGKLSGQLPNLDCIDDNKDLSPSQNWYYKDDTEATHPWGRQWRFKVRVFLAGFPDIFADDWFCIRVHNNWSFDRDNFLAQVPFTRVETIEYMEPPERLPTMCFEPCDVAVADFVPTPLTPVSCPECVNPDLETDIALIAIPKEISNVQPNEFLNWYEVNKNTVFDCEAVNTFIKSLSTNQAFKIALAQSGYVEPGVSQFIRDREVATLSSFSNFLQISVSRFSAGRNTTDLDAMMLAWRDKENTKLPTTSLGYQGEVLSFELTKT